ncbi:MAG: helix-turn-helix domain-containing protein [Planctomycetota bacterium]|jgi:AraC-like DNA-binding protein
MDNFTKHIRPFPRLYPNPARVSSIGYVSDKTYWVDRSFRTFNYSFILKGSGTYTIKERTYQVEAPYVITQWPGVHVSYGPETEWEELYLVYSRRMLSSFKDAGLADIERPAWKINSQKRVSKFLNELLDLFKNCDLQDNVDRIDRTCEMLIMESLINENAGNSDSKELAVRNIQSLIEENFHLDQDFDELALDEGMSPSDFRRHWKRFFNIPPAKYLSEFRLRQACRMLAETDLAIGEVAEKVNIFDPLYFSRKFRQFAGVTPTEYRRIHSADLSITSL